MKMRVKNWFRAVVQILAVVGWSGLALGQSHDYVFTIDQARSNMTFQIVTSVGTDSDNSSVVGTVEATITPPNGVFTSIHITDIVADLVKTHIHFDFLFGLWTVDGYNAGIRMGGIYGQAGPAVVVSGGNFSQTSNLVQGVGQIDYNLGTFGSGSTDLGTVAPSNADFIGTIVGNGQNITLTIPISLSYMNVGDLGVADAYVNGQIIATTETYYLTCDDMEEFYLADINQDCYVDIHDLVEFMQNWLQCNDPENSDCQ